MPYPARVFPPLTAEQASLAASFHGRALAMAASVGRGLPSLYHDDMRSAAGWGCVFAAALYEPATGPWEPWAYWTVKKKLWDALRDARRRQSRTLEFGPPTERLMVDDPSSYRRVYF